MKYYTQIILILFINFSLILINESYSFPSNLIFRESNLLALEQQPSSDLYSLNELNTIYLEFSQPDWWAQLTNNYGKKIDIPATLKFKDKILYNVGVRFRGQTSYQMVRNQKKSFNISIDFIDKNQRLEGYKTLNLNNCFDDPSFMREVLYCHLIGKNIPGAKANFVKLVINGENWGIYTNVQQLNKDFYNEWFLSGDGTNWRAEYPDTSTAKPKPGQGNPGFGEGVCSLNYISNIPLTYSRYYTLKSTTKEDPWTDLMISCQKLNQLPTNLLYDSLKYFIDVDRALWHLANEIIFTDDDGYVNKGGMDYYVYYDIETIRLQPIEYDGNSTFLIKNQNWSIFQKETNTKYPLINRLLSNPNLKQRYVAHARTIINNLLQVSYIDSLLVNYRALIEKEVLADTKKIYSNTQYQTSINDIKNFIQNRRNSLLNTPMLKAEAPKIDFVERVNQGGGSLGIEANKKVTIKAKVNHSAGINKVFLYYGTGIMGTFERIEMFDDGTHNDGPANDGVYACEIGGFPAGSFVRYYVEAIANNQFFTSSFSPEGAEHNVYFFRVNIKTEQNFPVVINEFMASNTKTIQDPQGDYDDWIELFNTSSNDINLSGMYLSDKLDNLKKWKFPDNTIIKANGYLIIWADEDGKATPGLHANFKLSADGEVILFVNSDANGNSICDSVTFGKQESDISTGRYPNGTGKFQLMPPTPGYENSTFTSIKNEGNNNDFYVSKIYPNPIDNELNFEVHSLTNDLINIRILNIFGEEIFNHQAYVQSGLNKFKLDLSNIENFGNGLYFLSISKKQNSFIEKIIRNK
ncbi:MAG: CotH kinase family protein [Candidatus Kapabacteria bacterium]|nr:CotH kinase family protein [Candidatus Kapabacteria bacterium]